MSRREDLDIFYGLLSRLEKKAGGVRRLADCTGDLNWPERGIYFIAEDGEVRENGTARVVRVGTHALSTGSKSTLWQRISAHKGNPGGKRPGGGNHRGSVFRLLVGSGKIERDGLDCPTWGVGSAASREIRDAEYEIEKLVSQHIGQMHIMWLEDKDAPGPNSMRALLERHSIALLSNYRKPEAIDKPSGDWLGKYVIGRNADKIRESGLWNVNHVDGYYTDIFLMILEGRIEGWLDDETGNSTMRTAKDMENAYRAGRYAS